MASTVHESTYYGHHGFDQSHPHYRSRPASQQYGLTEPTHSVRPSVTPHRGYDKTTLADEKFRPYFASSKPSTNRRTHAKCAPILGWGDDEAESVDVSQAHFKPAPFSKDGVRTAQNGSQSEYMTQDCKIEYRWPKTASTEETACDKRETSPRETISDHYKVHKNDGAYPPPIIDNAFNVEPGSVADLISQIPSEHLEHLRKALWSAQPCSHDDQKTMDWTSITSDLQDKLGKMGLELVSKSDRLSEQRSRKRAQVQERRVRIQGERIKELEDYTVTLKERASDAEARGTYYRSEAAALQNEMDFWEDATNAALRRNAAETRRRCSAEDEAYRQRY